MKIVCKVSFTPCFSWVKKRKHCLLANRFNGFRVVDWTAPLKWRPRVKLVL